MGPRGVAPGSREAIASGDHVLLVGPRGFEPRTCGLRVRSERAGHSAGSPVSSAFASLWFPSFRIVSRSFTGMRRDKAPNAVVISTEHWLRERERDGRSTWTRQRRPRQTHLSSVRVLDSCTPSIDTRRLRPRAHTAEVPVLRDRGDHFRLLPLGDRRLPPRQQGVPATSPPRPRRHRSPVTPGWPCPHLPRKVGEPVGYQPCSSSPSMRVDDSLDGHLTHPDSRCR
jgi:hypothetical protein